MPSVDSDKVESVAPGRVLTTCSDTVVASPSPPPRAPRRCESHASCIAHPPDPPPLSSRETAPPETERERAKERTRRGGGWIRSADTIILNFVRSVTPPPCAKHSPRQRNKSLRGEWARINRLVAPTGASRLKAIAFYHPFRRGGSGWEGLEQCSLHLIVIDKEP